MLCDRCRDIELASGSGQEVVYTHSSLSEVLDSTSECKGCEFFSDALKHFSLSDSATSPGFQTDQGDFSAEVPNYLSKAVVIVSKTDTQSRFEDISVRIEGRKGVYSTPLEAFLLRGALADDQRVLGRSVDSKPGSEVGLTWIQQCLHHCANDTSAHPHCAKASDGAWNTTLPSRVLNLQGSSEDSDVFITPNPDASSKGQYAALSHRWGGKIPLTSTTMNIEAHMRKMSWSSLPIGFQDAIRICRRLSIPYLWIDSLCILQDSKDDWAAESVKMTDVYSDAYVVLAHSSAWDSTYSILTERQPSPTLKLSGNNLGIYLRHLRDSNLKSFYRLFENRFTTEYKRDFLTTTYDISTLGSRGWTFQERLLAPRLVYFTACQLTWQCRSRNLVESSVDSSDAVSADVLMAREAEFAFEELGLNILPNRFSSPAMAVITWQAVISVYSDMVLTYETDRLVALAGLARRFKDFIGSDYLAGLWRNWFPLLLTWQSMFLKGKRPKAYRAPSWSWAAIDGRIYYSFVATDEEFLSTIPSVRRLEILDVSVETYDSREFSPITGAQLRIRGLCAKLDYHDSSDRSYGASPIDFVGKWSKSRGSGWDLDVNDEFRPSREKQGQTIEQGVYYRPEGGNFLAIQVIMRTRARNWDFSSSSNRDANVFCLLLKAVDGCAGTYKRAGSMRVEDTIIPELGAWEEMDLVLI